MKFLPVFAIGLIAFPIFGGAQQPDSTTPAAAQKGVAANSAPAKQDRAASYYHYSLAHLYEDMVTNYGRPEYASQAIEEYKLALGADSESAYLNNGLAELYFKVGRIKDAVLEAQDVLKKDPNNLGAHKLLGRIYLRSLGDMQNSQSEQVLKLAIAEYIKINQLEPNSVENHLLLGQLYSVNHSGAEAEEQFRAARKIDPASEEAVLDLARLYSEEGDVQRSVDTLSAVPADQRTARIEFALGANYDLLKQPKKAIEAYRSSLEMEPDNLDVERGLAQDLLNDNQLDQAQKSYEEISTADPQDALAYLRIAEIERRRGKYDQALATLKKAKALVSDSLEVTYNEALIYDSLGRYDEATSTLEQLVAASYHADGHYSESDASNRALFLDRLANIYREQNKTELAVATYRKLIELGGEFRTRGYQSIVDAYHDGRQAQLATAAAQEAAQKLPKDRTIQLMYARELADDGKVDQALKLAAASSDGTPESDREVALALEQIYERQRRWKEAAEQLDKAEKLSPHPSDMLWVYFFRGELAEHQKHYDEAEQEFRKVLAIDPNHAVTLNYLGYMFADRGVRLDESLTLIKKAVELDPQNYAYLDSLGWAFFKLGQYQLAEDNLRKALDRQFADPSVHDHLGELYEKTGRLKQAAAQWEIALAGYSKSNPADYDQTDLGRVQKKLETARVRLAKEEGHAQVSAGSNSNSGEGSKQ